MRYIVCYLGTGGALFVAYSCRTEREAWDWIKRSVMEAQSFYFVMALVSP